MSVLEHFVVAWATAFVINVIPAFMPPTWAVVSFFLIRFELPLLPLAIGSAAAATGGRVILALLTRQVGPRFMTKDMRRNMEALAAYLRGHQKGVGLGVLGFALFSPIPSNQLFMAAGLANLDLKLAAPAFFIGRSISYTVAAGAAGKAAADLTDVFTQHLSSAPAILVELLSLASIVLLARIPWARLLHLPPVVPTEAPIHDPVANATGVEPSPDPSGAGRV
jgi:membrane protein YqaA with SNARE-associated domain